MQKFEITPELKTRLERMDSPIAKAILAMEEVDNNNKLYVNFLSVARDNCAFLSYMDKAKIERYGSVVREVQEVDTDLPYILEFSEVVPPEKFNPDLKGKYKNWCGTYYINHIPGITGEDLLRQIKTGWYSFFSLMDYDSWLGWYNNHKISFSMDSTLRTTRDKLTGLKPQYKTIRIEEKWNPDVRQMGAAAKVVRKLFGETFSSDDYEKFATQFKLEAMKECGTDGRFIYEEMVGEKIKWAYDGGNYGGRSESELGSSCMKHEQCQKYFDIYIKNPDKCKLATFVEDGKLVARALVWRGVDGVDVPMYDRIYACDHDTYLMMTTHLKDLGYRDIYNNGEYSITLDNWDHEYYPYIDTFRYSNGNRFYSDEDSDYDRCYNDTGGHYDGWNGTDECARCGDDTEDLVEIGLGNHRGEMLCEDCRCYSTHHGEYLSTNDAQYIPSCSDYVLQSEAILSNHHGTWFIREQTITTEEGHVHLIDDESNYWVEIKGKRYTLNEDEMTEVDGEWVFTADLQEEEQETS